MLYYTIHYHIIFWRTSNLIYVYILELWGPPRLKLLRRDTRTITHVDKYQLIYVMKRRPSAANQLQLQIYIIFSVLPQGGLRPPTSRGFRYTLWYLLSERPSAAHRLQHKICKGGLRPPTRFGIRCWRGFIRPPPAASDMIWKGGLRPPANCSFTLLMHCKLASRQSNATSDI